MRNLIHRLLAARRGKSATRDPAPGPAHTVPSGPRVVDGFLEACACGTDVDAFLRGPRGGSAQNCQCPACGDWYNLGWIPGHHRPLFLDHQGQRTDIDLRPNAPGSAANN